MIEAMPPNLAFVLGLMSLLLLSHTIPMTNPHAGLLGGLADVLHTAAPAASAGPPNSVPPVALECGLSAAA